MKGDCTGTCGHVHYMVRRKTRRKRGRESVCVRERERERSVCVCEREREREREVCVCEREREQGRRGGGGSLTMSIRIKLVDPEHRWFLSAMAWQTTPRA